MECYKTKELARARVPMVGMCPGWFEIQIASKLNSVQSISPPKSPTVVYGVSLVMCSWEVP